MEVLDPPAVRRWARLAADALGRARADIDALNVFPVADGDTGTNLYLTMLSAAEAVEELPDDVDAAVVWQTLSYGALVGARGNSGVIVSQALRGLAEVLKHGSDLRAGLARAAALARQSVARPVEGTVLSVLAAVARAVQSGDGGLDDVARRAAEEARAALRRTPGQLDVLARSGVVDAGGAGLAILLESLATVITGAHRERYDVPTPTARVSPMTEVGAGYEVMYLLDADDRAVDTLRAELDALGDSLVVVGGEGLWNVHVHVAEAGLAIEAALRVGRPHRIRVTYLAERPRSADAGRGVVAVAAGEGIAALFEECGAVVVRREPGGRPALPAMLAAIRQAGNEVAVLPNDDAAGAVAAAAAEIAREDGVVVSVLPTKATVQGLAALAVHDPLRRFDDDVVAMTDAAGHTRHGHLVLADRHGVTSAGLCAPGDVLGLIDGDVAVIGATLAEVAALVVDRMVAGGGELVTLVTGALAPARLATGVEEHLGRTRPDVDLVVYEGEQGGYPLLIGVE
ncbi:DAK2 domain-containing protein [Nonomuraea glycinis]|uniref:Dihydroxyacetone kinase n=1 Tax=Nonomuraea glycinis TaxID=2047744 RepID=A0A918E2Q1_9ACTN|nr:DAK2 domain-containing protein [Nonomuraea glycinis]MCA2175104.1 DAK2 domain-containing protein [Nonomuraea glycinis]GGP00864.1 dihydroxyacetone kinase [Nonomuraea glycinis]